MKQMLNRVRSNASFERLLHRAYTRFRGNPIGRPAVALLRDRSLRDLTPEARAQADAWRQRKIELRDTAPLGLFDVVSAAAHHIVSEGKTLELFGLPLALRARTIVELGCATSYYNLGVPYPKAVRQTHEGLMSTRVLGAACQLLRATGTEATLHSVDIRELEEMSQRSLMDDLGFGDLWHFHSGTDSISWVRDFQGEIDVLLVDSNHTYEHVRDELAAALPKMAPRSAIVVDNCYTTIYRPGVPYMSDESPAGIEHGGQFGAVLEFLAANPEWTAYWRHVDVVTLTRGWDLPANLGPPEWAREQAGE